MKNRMDRSIAEVLADDLWNDLVTHGLDSWSVRKTHKKLLADFIEGLADAIEYDMLDEWMYRRSQEPIGGPR